jgi:hypothetical protein
MKDHAKRPGGLDPTAASENDDMVVGERLKNATGMNPSDLTRRPAETHPTADAGDEPAFNRPGVGGRTSPRQLDEEWTPGDGTPGMGSKPSPSIETVAPDETDMEAEAVPITESPQQRYAEAMKASLEDRGVDIRQLEARLPGLQGEARQVLEEQLDRLYALQEEATRRLGELGEAGSTTWKSVQESMEKTYDDLRNTLQGALSRFSK